MTTVFVLKSGYNVLDCILQNFYKALYKAAYVCKLDHVYFTPYTHCFSFAFGGDQVHTGNVYVDLMVFTHIAGTS